MWTSEELAKKRRIVSTVRQRHAMICTVVGLIFPKYVQIYAIMTYVCS